MREHSYESYLVSYIRMASLALDELFVQRLVDALKPLGDGLTQSSADGKPVTRVIKDGKVLVEIRRAPVKSAARMLNKLHSADDHRDKPPPRPKWNVDTVRAGVVVHDAALVHDVYSAIGRKVGPYLRVKNGFAAADASFGYRAILGNLRLESGLTVRQVFGGVDEEAWREMGLAAEKAGDSFAPTEMRAVLAALLCADGDNGSAEWMKEYNRDMPDKPLNIAAEVQIIYRPYLERGRKLSHLLYKIVRCTAVSELARDASGKRRQARELVARAEAWCMGVVPALIPTAFGLPAGWVPPAFPTGKRVLALKRRKQRDPRDRVILLGLPELSSGRPVSIALEVGPKEPLELIARELIAEFKLDQPRPGHGYYPSVDQLAHNLSELVRGYDQQIVEETARTGERPEYVPEGWVPWHDTVD